MQLEDLWSLKEIGHVASLETTKCNHHEATIKLNHESINQLNHETTSKPQNQSTLFHHHAHH